jgi:hypothetical protein
MDFPDENRLKRVGVTVHGLMANISEKSFVIFMNSCYAKMLKIKILNQVLGILLESSVTQEG